MIRQRLSNIDRRFYNKDIVDYQKSINVAIDDFMNSNIQIPNTSLARKDIYRRLLFAQKNLLGNLKNYVYYRVKFIETQNIDYQGDSIFYFEQAKANANTASSCIDEFKD
ncbi:hypothetical protein [Pectinatus sottacetonis]|uniref:hypothetical protein n=1 Tax=Pectinatus sottacetonis TaxID=1002795 RepID=UPI0018C60119|nr:hypothetical protein [Pectinatus sottacetonis]